MELGRNALEAMLQVKNCILCGGNPDVAGLFMPEYGSPKLKVLYYAYALCEACYIAPNKAEIVEQKIGTFVSSRQELN
jgi:hypothetical protein